MPISRKASLGIRLVATTVRRLVAGDIGAGELCSLLPRLRGGLPRPAVQVLAEDSSDHTTLLEIGGTRIWWPREYSTHLLDLVWSEVFQPYPPNGHAYEHRLSRLRPGDWVLDGGACEGFFVKYALVRGCNVIAVEPLKRLAQALEKTFRQEVSAGRVKIVNAALAAALGKTHLRMHGTPFGARESDVGDEISRVTVDDLVYTNRVAARLDFIKMDIEGAEVSALRGSLRTLQDMRPSLSIAVYHYPDEEREVRNLLRETGGGYVVEAKGLVRTGPALVHQVLHATCGSESSDEKVESIGAEH